MQGKNMKILFLDDDSIRIKQARVDFENEALSVAETAEQAIRLLEKYSPYDVISLDHDLGGKIYCPSDDMSGYAVAEYISKMSKEKMPKQVVVHSFNPDGAAKMKKVLQGVVPVLQQPFHMSKNINFLPSDYSNDDILYRLMHWGTIHTLMAVRSAQLTNLMQFVKSE
jgi:CheY-like chemotaxis protein